MNDKFNVVPVFFSGFGVKDVRIVTWYTYNCLYALSSYIFLFRIGSGTSHNGSGVLGLFKPSSERQIVTYSVNLIKALQEDGHSLGMCNESQF